MWGPPAKPKKGKAHRRSLSLMSGYDEEVKFTTLKALLSIPSTKYKNARAHACARVRVCDNLSTPSMLLHDTTVMRSADSPVFWQVNIDAGKNLPLGHQARIVDFHVQDRLRTCNI